MSDLKKIDEKLSALERERRSVSREENRQFTTQIGKRFLSTVIFWSTLVRAWRWVWNNFTKPVLHFFWSIMAWVWNHYRFLWNRLTYRKDSFGDRRFSVTRGGVMLIATFGFLWYMAVPLLGFIADTGLYFTTVKYNQEVYLSNPQEILPEDDIHSVQGCLAEVCTDNESIYYRITPSLFNELWSIWNGRGLFYPDLLAAVVPPSSGTRCLITSYGIRVKLFMGLADVYPELLEITCFRNQ